ncbi:hypothetical protein GSI_14289 [Ganoderma sinense ZZ0214-1]|uniref:Uncharacterized protein n=1 Tax=Ganoderma sinense ZZ0214-1 TaxID=1077348 RepID=A0A2G8RSQ9_9APHY|nr:hypothetical protein GSI_14289 [Ganoderma sinense ZZ0214-1]
MQANPSYPQQPTSANSLSVKTWKGRQGVIDEHLSVTLNNVTYVGLAIKMVESAEGDKIVLWFLGDSRRTFPRDDCTPTLKRLTVAPPPQQPIQQVVPTQQGLRTLSSPALRHTYKVQVSPESHGLPKLLHFGFRCPTPRGPLSIGIIGDKFHAVNNTVGSPKTSQVFSIVIDRPVATFVEVVYSNDAEKDPVHTPGRMERIHQELRNAFGDRVEGPMWYWDLARHGPGSSSSSPPSLLVCLGLLDLVALRSAPLLSQGPDVVGGPPNLREKRQRL